MNGILLFFLCLILLTVLLMLKALSSEKKKNAEFIERLKESFGKSSPGTTEPETLRLLAGLAGKGGEGDKEGFVDDITWRDLEMDEIFVRMNTTLSSPGEEALYELLRRPLHDEKLLKKRGRILDFFAKNETERLKFQKALHAMGRRRKATLSEQLSLLENVRTESNLLHFLCALLGIAAIALIFIKPALGFVVFIAVLFFNVSTYFKRKGETDQSLSAFAYLLRALRELEKLPELNAEELKEETERIREARKILKPLSRGAFLLMGGRDLTGNLWEIPLDYLRIFFHVDLIKFNSMLRFVRSRSDKIRELFDTVGYLDAMIAVSSFRESLQAVCEPEFTKGEGASFEAGELFHPLLKDPVSADISSSEKGVLLTGSNASGKSTFLKSVGLSILLSQTVYYAPARYLRLSFLDILSSMSLSDSLVAGESYYMAEIRAVKRMADRASEEGKTPVACFLDELLRGTNTIERIAASSGILRRLKNKNTLVFAATHDIELTGMLEDHYENYHFEDEVRDGDITFSYRLLKGRAKTRNAIRLLELIGFDKETVDGAFATAGRFEKEGEWPKL